MMASEESDNRKCFTFIWKLENVSYSMSNDDGYIASPNFIVDELKTATWTLEISFSHNRRNGSIEMRLRRCDYNDVYDDEIDYEFALLSSNGKILRSFEGKTIVIRAQGSFKSTHLVSRNEVFFARRSDYLPHDTLTARCRMWRSYGEMSKDVQCFARSRVTVEKRSFLWNVENFSHLKCNEKKTYKIKSFSKLKHVMSLKLFLTSGRIRDEIIHIQVLPNYWNIKLATIKLYVVDALENSVKCFEDEFWHKDVCEENEFYDYKEFTLIQTKRELLENNCTYLRNDVLSLWCECAFSDGTVSQEIEMADSDCSAVAKKESDNEANNVPVSCCILVDNLKSMLYNSCLSDVTLKTKSQTYPAHMFILGARSPVFKSMFSNVMLKKIDGCVEIENLEEDTVLRLLRYIYSAEVEDLDWASATELYEAADKYQIASLKEKCSSNLKRILCANKSCDTLVFADRHQDDDLKRCVQDYILRHGEDVINSEAWDQLMKTNVNLAAETMRLKFKE